MSDKSDDEVFVDAEALARERYWWSANSKELRLANFCLEVVAIARRLQAENAALTERERTCPVKITQEMLANSVGSHLRGNDEK